MSRWRVFVGDWDDARGCPGEWTVSDQVFDWFVPARAAMVALLDQLLADLACELCVRQVQLGLSDLGGGLEREVLVSADADNYVLVRFREPGAGGG